MRMIEPGGMASTKGQERLRVTVEPLETHTDLQECVELQRQVWGMGESGVVPASQLHAAIHAGGSVLGVRAAERLIGFAFAFPAYRPERHPAPGLHSDMAAVLAEYRGRGVGQRLKQVQREWALERGFEWIQWTFDPLRAANARFNLEHLGALCFEYIIDAYGVMDDGLNAGLPSDRLMAHWDLQGSEAGRRDDLHPGVPVLFAGTEGEPELLLGESADRLHVAIPPELDRLRGEDGETALRWRLALREVLVHYLGRGYGVIRFLHGGYVLTAGLQESENRT